MPDNTEELLRFYKHREGVIACGQGPNNKREDELYLSVLAAKFKEVILSVLPIVIIVLILNFTLVPMELPLVFRFIIGALFITAGLTVFLVGVDIGITPIGNNIGSGIAKSNKVWIVVFAGFLLGTFISIAEPDLHILAGQVAFVTSGTVSKTLIVIIVSLGVALLLSFGLLRIVYNLPLYVLLTALYGIIFIIAIFTSREFLAISFDASGATTGALTVPFILALAIGVSNLKKDSKASEKDSFGLVAIASTGAIIAVMLLSIITRQESITVSLDYDKSISSEIFLPFFREIPKAAGEISLALAPILLIFLLFQKISFKLSGRVVRKILFGILFTFLGMVLFITGVNKGYMDVGSTVGYNLASLENKAYIIIVGFILGLVTILAEPAVYVLTHQIEDVTSGYVNRKMVMLVLSIGVGIAVALSVLRVLIPRLQLWHYILPGYIICIGMTYIVPKLFVGMAFDSGGVASGPMTATFILAYIQGAADAVETADVLIDGFGMIAMVAMTPIISLEILGLIYKIRSRKKGVNYHV